MWLWLLLMLLTTLASLSLVTLWLYYEKRFDYDAGKRNKSIDQLPGSNLVTRTKVVVIGTMPGTPLDERPAWRLAQALKVPYLELSNANIFFNSEGQEHESDASGGSAVSSSGAVIRPRDWRKEAEIKQRFPSRVGDMVRRFFSKNKYNGYVIDMILDRWETYDALFEEVRDIVWLDLSLAEYVKALLWRMVQATLLQRSRPMFREDAEQGRLAYTRYWYHWGNLLCLWDANRSLLAKTISVYYKNQHVAPFLLDHNGQIECWPLRSSAEFDTLLQAAEAEKKKEKAL
jgi:hypothetical protein